MKLITAFALAAKKQSELEALFRQVSEELVATKPHSIERENALGSLQNIKRAMAALRMGGPKF
jgi:hypothetical protein